MGSIFDGQPVNASITNNSKLDRQTDDTAFGIISLNNTAVPSGPFIANVQKAINALYTATGASEAGTGTVYSDPNTPKTVNDGDTYQTAIGKIVSKLSPAGAGTIQPVTGNPSSRGTAASQVAKEDHTHEGMHSTQIFGDAVALKGDVVLQAQSGITLTRSGQTIIMAAGGGGGGGTVALDAMGNFDVTLTPPGNIWIIQSPDTTNWLITVTNLGVLVSTSGAAGSPTNIKVTKPDLSEASFQIDNAGVLSVVSPPPGGETLNNSFYLVSIGSVAWKVKVNNANQIIMDNTAATSDYAQFKNSVGTILWRVQEVGGLAVQYLPIFTAGNIPPANFLILSNMQPMAFYDNGANKRLMYSDYTNWRYVFDNSIII